MSFFQPADLSPPNTNDEDPRLGHLLTTSIPNDQPPTAVLVGMPIDEGVVRNGGRAGASEVPDTLRKCLYDMTPDARRSDAFLTLLRRTQDLGNLQFNASLSTRQATLGTALAPHLQRPSLPIILGGGHETTFGHFLGYVDTSTDVTILNWDANPTVRPLNDGMPHSGSVFRQALTHPSGHCQHYTVAGLQPHSTPRPTSSSSSRTGATTRGLGTFLEMPSRTSTTGCPAPQW